LISILDFEEGKAKRRFATKKEVPLHQEELI
jgi:hypothetical protein